METNLSKIKPKLRTEGRVSGNFGRNKVEGKRKSLDLSANILNKKNLRIPNPIEVYERLEQAYTITTDPELKAFLAEMLKKRKATTQTRAVENYSLPVRIRGGS